jgi:hypothetical protein
MKPHEQPRFGPIARTDGAEPDPLNRSWSGPDRGVSSLPLTGNTYSHNKYPPPQHPLPQQIFSPETRAEIQTSEIGISAHLRLSPSFPPITHHIHPLTLFPERILQDKLAERLVLLDPIFFSVRRRLPLRPPSPSPSDRNRRPCRCPSIEKAIVARSSLLSARLVLFLSLSLSPRLFSGPRVSDFMGTEILFDSASTSRRAGGVSRPRTPILLAVLTSKFKWLTSRFLTAVPDTQL